MAEPIGQLSGSPRSDADAVGPKSVCDDASWRSAEVEGVLGELRALRAEMVAIAPAAQRQLDEVHANFRDSARNLLHYLTLRRHDLRSLQLRLATLGLSSLGRAESHVLAAVDAVLKVLVRLAGHAAGPPPPEGRIVSFDRGQRLLAEHADALLGPPPAGRAARIMVTMPSEAGEDCALVHDLVKQGMDCMRINCAHDDPDTWLRMIQHLRRAEQALGRSCRIVMDIAGPKLRTGPLEPGPAVARVRPRRDVYGRVTAPARVWLTSEAASDKIPSPAVARLPVPGPWLAGLRLGERVKFTDARGAHRVLRIVDVTDRGCWAETTKTAYVVPGTVLRRRRGLAGRVDPTAPVGELPPGENAIFLQPGDSLMLTRDLRAGRPATYDGGGRVLTPATIGCTMPEVFEDVRSGDAIRFDDGKIGGTIERIESDRLLVRITQAGLHGEKLRAGKGINLPDSPLRLPALTAKDLDDLTFLAQYADIIELSFARGAGDVELLQRRLTRLGARQPAIVLKIETRRGFEHLPEMLLAAMRAPCCGVMIARGDLAVECGFERLAEVQEEILWICEAAHVPVIWATQVLETLAKKGTPSRAEISDAAMGHRAECIMLNKGPHIVSAVRVLDDILRRMQGHETKKRAMLRELHLAHALAGEVAPGADESAK